ncbi:hypothetical protein [Actinoplanes derwentensis]|uniref:FtsH ternary system domain-containing protein n=1 Tax=Actinoplanes derwentensis TaxID=113562 RepID=A0A1H2AIK7_9ACTN|nr:hypothetical protein [Actinoplanes derwentensis]GID90302.1 hypothetical protein Ade03nite_92260 [Actinoplanes derwentensis]SDT45750.1 hypothetical protein SAMN04489716_3886 [Actinoplanes derwentensis]
MTAAGPIPGLATTSRWGETAAATTVQVLTWAAAPSGPPPLGTLRRVGDLVSVPAVGERLRALTRVTAARSGAGNPPLGDASAVGAGAVLLAASIGGRTRPDLSTRLAAALPAPRLDQAAATGWADALARHAVAGAALSAPDHGPDDLAGAWLDASPLTAVLLAPHPSGRQTAVRTALALARRPGGPGVLTHVLAGCHPDVAVLQWRGDVLLRLAAEHPGLVLDVYLAARNWHAAAWDARMASATRRIAASAAAGRPDADALRVVRFWAGLTARPVAALLARGRFPAALRDLYLLVRRHPAAGVSDL